jgi:hypothetical protein
MNRDLKDLIDTGAVGFEDIFEAYAQICINHVRTITEDMILDEGITVVSEATDLTTEGLTAQAVDWATIVVPEMVGDDVDPTVVKKEDESWLEFVLRTAVEKRVKKTKAFQVKFS